MSNISLRYIQNPPPRNHTGTIVLAFKASIIWCCPGLTNWLGVQRFWETHLWQQAFSINMHFNHQSVCRFAVEFIGEKGVDVIINYTVHALCMFMYNTNWSTHFNTGVIHFELLLGCINDIWFEEAPGSHLSKKDWGNEHNMKTAGAMIAHSITYGWPGFLCPAVV